MAGWWGEDKLERAKGTIQHRIRPVIARILRVLKSILYTFLYTFIPRLRVMRHRYRLSRWWMITDGLISTVALKSWTRQALLRIGFVRSFYSWQMSLRCDFIGRGYCIRHPLFYADLHSSEWWRYGSLPYQHHAHQREVFFLFRGCKNLTRRAVP